MLTRIYIPRYQCLVGKDRQCTPRIMASSSSSTTGTAVDGQPVPVAGEGAVVVLKSVKWDPFSSPDWDNEKHTKEALVRIKRSE